MSKEKEREIMEFGVNPKKNKALEELVKKFEQFLRTD